MPKPLLPVGNVPMVAYALESLQRHKFEGSARHSCHRWCCWRGGGASLIFGEPSTDVIVVVQETASRALRTYLAETPKLHIKADIVTVPDQTYHRLLPRPASARL